MTTSCLHRTLFCGFASIQEPFALGRLTFESESSLVANAGTPQPAIEGSFLLATLRFRSADSELSVAFIARLRSLTQLSISEIRTRAANAEPLIEITPFRNDWEESRQLLVQLSGEIDNGTLPLKVTEVFEGTESSVSPEMLRNLIHRFRGIELETDMLTDLELGEISDPSEFEPHDEDWTNQR